MTFTLIVPTYQPGAMWNVWLKELKKQTLQPDEVIIIDSSSTDSTAQKSLDAGYKPIIIPTHTFNHGGTRNYGVNCSKGTDIIVFLTQDAIFSSSNSLKNIINVFNDISIAAVCGKQLPNDDANPIARHARFFNYQTSSIVKDKTNIASLGLKVAFISNSFSAYRRSIFDELDGFPNNTILAEDMYLAAKMILAGYKVAYCAEATVKHSHNYTPWQEFHRYFDTGVFHACEPWIQEKLGGVSGEGLRFIKSELKYLWHHAPLWIPRALLTTGCKFLGYKLGRHYKTLPKSWRSKFSMYRSYWLQQKY